MTIATANISGNLTRDVDLRELPSGVDVARLRVATTTRRRNGEEWVEKTNYFTVEVYGARARACAEYLGKGSRVVVDWREWTDLQDERREAVTFRARRCCSRARAPARTTAIATAPARRAPSLRGHRRPAVLKGHARGLGGRCGAAFGLRAILFFRTWSIQHVRYVQP